MKNKIISCPDDETMACYVDGLLPSHEKEELEQHFMACASCREILSAQIDIANSQRLEGLGDVPNNVTEAAKNLVNKEYGVQLFNLAVIFTEKAFDLIQTTGDIISGFQLRPAFVLRNNLSTNDVKTFTVRKNIGNIRVEIEASRERDDTNTIILRLFDISKNVPINGARVTLIHEDLELESYLTKDGKAIFESIRPGKYFIKVSQSLSVIATISLELNKK